MRQYKEHCASFVAARYAQTMTREWYVVRWDVAWAKPSIDALDLRFVLSAIGSYGRPFLHVHSNISYPYHTYTTQQKLFTLHTTFGWLIGDDHALVDA